MIYSLLIITFLFNVICGSTDDESRYQAAIRWIRNSSEVRQLIREHLGVIQASDSINQFAVLDSLAVLESFDFFDEDSCSLVLDTKTTLEGIRGEIHFLKEKQIVAYRPFVPLWNDTDKTILIVGYIYRNRLTAQLFLRPVRPDSTHEFGMDSSFFGIKVPMQGTRRSVREISRSSDLIVISMCFDKAGEVGNAVVKRFFR